MYPIIILQCHRIQECRIFGESGLRDFGEIDDCYFYLSIMLKKDLESESWDTEFWNFGKNWAKIAGFFLLSG